MYKVHLQKVALHEYFEVQGSLCQKQTYTLGYKRREESDGSAETQPQTLLLHCNHLINMPRTLFLSLPAS